jgi:hypothetical protein
VHNCQSASASWSPNSQLLKLPPLQPNYQLVI